MESSRANQFQPPASGPILNLLDELLCRGVALGAEGAAYTVLRTRRPGPWKGPRDAPRLVRSRRRRIIPTTARPSMWSGSASGATTHSRPQPCDGRFCGRPAANCDKFCHTWARPGTGGAGRSA